MWNAKMLDWMNSSYSTAQLSLQVKQPYNEKKTWHHNSIKHKTDYTGRWIVRRRGIVKRSKIVQNETVSNPMIINIHRNINCLLRGILFCHESSNVRVVHSALSLPHCHWQNLSNCTHYCMDKVILDRSLSDINSKFSSLYLMGFKIQTEWE